MTAKHNKKITSWESDPAEREPPKTCSVSGKRMYASEAAAKSTAAHQMSKETAPAKLRTYKCLYCGAWHLTSKET
jgi:hypothetical protein